ncbi:MAG TPA: hypothetical protein VD970_10345 [Acetobacteraceae bacterium]|nr:hypothetical protein [Acetobacteraceae bacterium]
MRHVLMAAVASASFGLGGSLRAEEDYASWPLLPPVFESTGGGGIMIGEYEPVVIRAHCLTRFTATEPNGTVHRNIILFDAMPAQGGVLCTNGAWRSLDNDAEGTTPFRVYLRDGVRRRSP